jgi:hypothetical protein
MSAPLEKGRLYIQLAKDGETCGPPHPVAWRASAGPERPAHCRFVAWDFCGSCEQISVRAPAKFLGLKPFNVVAELLKVGVLVNADQSVNLQTGLTLLKQYGYTVQRA